MIINDLNLKTKLENLIHPFVKEEIYQELLMNPLKKYILDVPLLFESSLDKICDKLDFVDINEDVQHDRLINRGTMPLNDAKMLEKSIQKNNLKKQKCDFVISNNGTIEELKENVKDLINEINK